MNQRAIGAAMGVVAAVVVACGDSGESGRTDGTDGGSITVGTDASSASATGADSSSSGTTGEAPECLLDVDCDGGKCIDGACCAATDVCEDSCCGDGELCLFDGCAVPGATCTTPEDCDDGEYCELAFGDPGGGMGQPPAPGLVCTETLPPSGACIGLPDKCDDPGADPNHCVDACEFQPVAGQLDTIIEWQWGLADAGEYPESSDVWATPTVARMYDANCDGEIDRNDPPNIVFVAGDTNETCCSCGDEAVSSCKTGVLRMLDGKTGAEIWSLPQAQPGQFGFAGLSVALGDVDVDGFLDVVAMTGDGYPVLVDRLGQVIAIADAPVPGTDGSFGWGGGMALADMDGDGSVEIAYGRTLYSTQGGAITKLWDGAGGSGGGSKQALSFMVDLAGGPALELLAGNTVYDSNGAIVWQRAGLPDGFTAVGDLDKDGTPEVVLVTNSVWVLDGATGATELGPTAIPGDYTGGPPTVADFDGDGMPEIGVAGGQAYVVYEPDYAAVTLASLWTHATKDTSSAVTGSSVFDFEGDGKAEVVYSDECFLRVLDGTSGTLRFAAPNTTFTATEALIVADVDGDQHAEIVRVSNSANWDCDTPPWNQPDPVEGRPAWEPPPGQNYYQGLTVFGDAKSSWVGTRTLWNQHAYFVSNVCDGHDSACQVGDGYGAIPKAPKHNWSLDWLDNFRQNVQDEGIFDAPDAILSLDVECMTPVLVHVAIRNAGFAPLPTGVTASVTKQGDATVLGTVVTTQPLLPGQTAVLDLELPMDVDVGDTFVGHIVTDPNMPTFVECKTDNNDSDPAKAYCGPG